MFALALLEMEYERYLPQSWIGLRGFWHLIGIEALVPPANTQKGSPTPALPDSAALEK